MFAVIYDFIVKPGQEKEFELSWNALTELIYQHENSYGSRLHKTSTGKYLAYAYWPDKNTWDKAGDLLPTEANDWRKRLRSSCSEIITLHEMELVNDKLRTETFK